MITGVEDEGEIRAEERKEICAGATLMATHAYTKNPEGPLGQEGERRKSYSAAVIYGIKRNSVIYVGDSIVRKTDTISSKGEDVVLSLFTGSKNRACDRVEESMGRGNGGSILVHVGTNNADKEETTAIFEKYRNLLKKTKQARVGQIILSGILPVFGNRVQ